MWGKMFCNCTLHDVLKERYKIDHFPFLCVALVLSFLLYEKNDKNNWKGPTTYYKYRTVHKNIFVEERKFDSNENFAIEVNPRRQMGYVYRLNVTNVMRNGWWFTLNATNPTW